MNVKKFFARHPVFTREEFENYVNRDEKRSHWTIKNMLAQHMDAGRLGRVRQGLYYVVPENYGPESYPVDPYLIASNIRDDSVIGYHSALQLHGHAHFVHHRYLYLTNDPPRPFTHRNSEFKAVKYPASLRKKNREKMFVETVDRQGLDVEVTNLERTFVDMLDRPDLAGGWESIWRSFEGIGYLKLDQVIDYVEALENQTTAGKVGFFLDAHREVLSVRDGDLKALEILSPSQPRYLDNKSKGGTLQKRWNLIVPDYVLRRGWEE